MNGMSRPVRAGEEPSANKPLSGKRRRFDAADANPDPRREEEPGEPSLLEYAEREGKLLACIAERDREIARLRKNVDRLESALAHALEQIACASIHEAPTNPPPLAADAGSVASTSPPPPGMQQDTLPPDDGGK
jgi:hypothetical protein